MSPNTNTNFNKISLSEAFDNSGYTKTHIMNQFGMTLNYYKKFVNKEVYSPAEILMIEKLTKLKKDDLYIKAKGEK